MMKNRTRPVRIEFRITEQERQLIQKKMEQLGTKNMGAYLRKMAIDGYIHQSGLYRAKEIGCRHQPGCRKHQPDLPPYQSDRAFL